ncbi:peptidoglycan DD-metalloendopeptidase family protein [candidate division WWE3 bacterium]|uniref:Peptidoglycan DD-metalloendopeptidase family protein n=1 Tax=candidate division WWE3 bacterium TaxID=2053526 RepID=A0A955RS83_UNCKA|nr:peptidoglycan DD-metalloendopeptidase family protein [candidate division WWE3 bacterium]
MDPLIPGLAARLMGSIIIFFTVFARRFSYYLVSLREAFVFVLAAASYYPVRAKKMFVRVLMYRGGFFNKSPRFGFAALISTTTFSLMLIPAIKPLDDSKVISDVIAAGQTISASSTTVLAASPSVGTEGSSASLRTEIATHVVAPGETLSSIAETYLVSVEGLRYVNGLGNDLIRPGDELTIPPVDGLIHTVNEGDTLASIGSTYNVPQQAIADFNSLEEPFVLHSGDELVIPDAQIPAPKPVVSDLASATEPANSGLVLQTTAVAANAGSGHFIMPANATLTQYFWWGHTAIDLANSCGTPIVASDSGTITFAGWWAGGGGNSIWIDHGNGYVTRYAHMSAFERTGGSVNRGDVIGYIGSTGRSTGCHVHFVVEQNGRPINPLSVL